jgi:hypothetical protein
MQARNLDAQLPPVAGRGQRYMANMKFRVKRLIADPVWEIGIEGDLNEPLPHKRREMRALRYGLDYAFEAYLPAGRG